MGRAGCRKQVRDQVAQPALALEGPFQCDLVQRERLEELSHFGQPLSLEKSLHFWVFGHLCSVEFPFHQFACQLQLLWRQVIAAVEICKYLLTDGHWSFDHLVVHHSIIEVEIEDVEVVAAVDGAHHGYPADEMMRELVSVALHYAVHRSHRHPSQQLADLIGSTARAALPRLLLPHSERVVRVAVVPRVAHDQNRICSMLPQLPARLNHYLRVVAELVGRKESFLEGSSSKRSLDCGQSDHPDLYPRSQFVQVTVLVLGQEFLLSALGTQVRGQVPGTVSSACEVVGEETRAEVKLVVAKGGTVDSGGIKVVIDDGTGTDQGAGLDSALELVAGV